MWLDSRKNYPSFVVVLFFIGLCVTTLNAVRGIERAGQESAIRLMWQLGKCMNQALRFGRDNDMVDGYF